MYPELLDAEVGDTNALDKAIVHQVFHFMIYLLHIKQVPRNTIRTFPYECQQATFSLAWEYCLVYDAIGQEICWMLEHLKWGPLDWIQIIISRNGPVHQVGILYRMHHVNTKHDTFSRVPRLPRDLHNVQSYVGLSEHVRAMPSLDPGVA